MILVYAAFILICLIGRDHFFFGTGLILGRWIFVAIGLALLVFAVKRRKATWLRNLMIFSLLLLAFEFSWNKINTATLTEGDYKNELSLLSYNIFFKNQAPKQSLAIIQESESDILFLQEITKDWEIRLKNSIERTYPYKSIYSHNGTHGIGVYSKHPILNTSYLYNTNKLPYAQIVEINAFGKRLQIINTHLASPAAAVENPQSFLSYFSSSYKERTNQLEQIEEIVEGSQSRVDVHILTGDLNTTHYEPLYRKLESNWVDLFDLVGIGQQANFPNSVKTGPFLTIDYIMIRGSLEGISAHVLDGGSSDHLAIKGKIRI